MRRTVILALLCTFIGIFGCGKKNEQAGEPAKPAPGKNKLAFVQDKYSFEIERDYDQWAHVEVVNNDTVPHRFLVLPGKVSQDLVAGFIGKGSVDELAELQPRQKKKVRLVLMAADATDVSSSVPCSLYMMDGKDNTDVVDTLPVDTATVSLKIKFPEFKLEVTRISENPATLGQIYSIKNVGGTIADFSLATGTNSIGQIAVEPSVYHADMRPGRVLRIEVAPYLYPGFEQLNASLVATGAGQEQEIPVSFTMPGGKDVYVGVAQSGTFLDSVSSWCLNAAWADGWIWDAENNRWRVPLHSDPPFSTKARQAWEWFKRRVREEWGWTPEVWENDANGVRGTRVRPAVLARMIGIELDLRPALSLTASDKTIHSIWHQGTRIGDRSIIYRRSAEQPGKPNPAHTLSPKGADAAWPWLLQLSPNQLIAAWEETRAGALPQITLRRTDDAGKTWQAPVTLAEHGKGAHDPILLSAGSGGVLALWEDRRHKTPEIYLSKSSDGGRSFGTPIRITESQNGCEWTAAALDAQGTLHIACEQRKGNLSTISYVKSDAQLQSFSNPRTVSPAGLDSGEPNIHVDAGGTVRIVFRGGDGKNSEIYHVASTDQGATWPEAAQLTDDNAYSEYPVLVPATQDRLGILYHSDLSGIMDHRYLLVTRDGGGTWSDGRRMPTIASCVKSAWLTVHFDLGTPRKDLEPVDVQFFLNGQLVGELKDTIPEGNHLFPVDPDILQYAKGGPANLFAFKSRINPGQSIRLKDIRLTTSKEFSESIVIASSQEEADMIASRETSTLNHTTPDVGIFANNVVIPGDLKDGDKVELPFKIVNLGQATSSELKLFVLDSEAIPSDAVLKEGDDVEALLTLPPLAPGEEVEVPVSLTFREGVTERLWYVVAGSSRDFNHYNNYTPVTLRSRIWPSPLDGIDRPVPQVSPKHVSKPTGSVFVTAIDSNGKSLGQSAAVSFFEPGTTNRLQEGKSGKGIDVPAGVYDVRTQYKHLRDGVLTKWFRGIRVRKDSDVQLKAEFVFVQVTVHAYNTRGARITQSRVLYYEAGTTNQPAYDVWTGSHCKILPGIYDIKVEHKLRRGSIVKWLKDTEIRPGDPVIVNAKDFAFSTVRLNAYDAKGVVMSQSRVLYYGTGKTDQPIYDAWTGTEYKILPGTYDIKIEHKLRKGNAVKWLREVRVPAGTNLTLRAEGIVFSRLKILAYDSDGKKLSSLRVSCCKSGDRTTVLYLLWTGIEYKILPGTYDIKIERKTAEGVVSKWIEKVTIEAGDRMQKKVSL